MPVEQRKVAKDRYTAPDGIPYAKGPRINDVVRRNMSRFNKDMDDDQRDIQSSFSAAIVPILSAMDGINTEGEINRKEVTEHLSMALATIGSASYAISSKRRDRIRPSLSKEYKELCADDVVITSDLLGDDCEASIKRIKETSKASLMAYSSKPYAKSSYKAKSSGQSNNQQRYTDNNRGRQQQQQRQQSSNQGSGFQGAQKFRKPWNNNKQYHK
jgi:hypothetical protein